jgi:hypothetical protein
MPNPPSRKEPIFLRFFTILKIVVNGYNAGIIMLYSPSFVESSSPAACASSIHVVKEAIIFCA